MSSTVILDNIIWKKKSNDKWAKIQPGCADSLRWSHSAKPLILHPSFENGSNQYCEDNKTLLLCKPGNDRYPVMRFSLQGPKSAAMDPLQEHCSCKHHASPHTHIIKIIIFFSSHHRLESNSHCSTWNSFPFTRWKDNVCVRSVASCFSQILNVSTSWHVVITFIHQTVRTLFPRD